MKVSHNFLGSYYVRASITAMKNAGMSDILIAMVLLDIRAAAIAEERLRMEEIRAKNPPVYPTARQLLEQMKEDS